MTAGSDPFDPRVILAGDEPARLCVCERTSRFALLDWQDHAWAVRWVWSVHYNQRGWPYPARQEGGWPRPRRRIYLHRAIMERVSPPPSEAHVVDHINGDTFDARRCNLRWATISENAKNTWVARLTQEREIG